MIIVLKNIIKSFAITSLFFNILASVIIYFYPAQLEKTAKEFIRKDIENTILTFHETTYHKKIPKFLKKEVPIDLENTENKLKKVLSKDLLFKVTETISSTCVYICPTSNGIENEYANKNSQEIEKALKSEKGLVSFVKYKYYKTLNTLLNDLIIFFGINAIIFSMVVGGVYLSSQHKFLFPISIILTISTFLAIFLYIFNTNWLYTIVFNDFMGFSYIFMVLGVFLLLSDLFLNKGKVLRLIAKLF